MTRCCKHPVYINGIGSETELELWFFEHLTLHSGMNICRSCHLNMWLYVKNSSCACKYDILCNIAKVENCKSKKVMTANQVPFSNIGSCFYISPSATRAVVYLLSIVYGNTLPMIKTNKVYLIIYLFFLTPVMVCLIHSSVDETIHGLIVVWELHPLQILAIVYLNCVQCLI